MLAAVGVAVGVAVGAAEPVAAAVAVATTAVVAAMEEAMAAHPDVADSPHHQEVAHRPAINHRLKSQIMFICLT